MATARLISVLLVLFFCMFDLVHAQPGYKSLESIDSMIANADFVCTAKVKEFKAIEVSDYPGPRKFRVVFEIREQLKAPDRFLTSPPVNHFTLFSNLDELTKWQMQESRLLLAVDLENADHNHVIDLDATNPRVLTSEFKVLKNSESILLAVKQVMETMPTQIKRLHTFELLVPADVQSKMNSDLQIMLRVPVNQRLEKKALAFLESNLPHVRSNGLRAIRFFKSKENIAVVRKLLDDPFKSPECGDDDNRLIYPVRLNAYNRLRSWNVDVEKPVLRLKKESGQP